MENFTPISSLIGGMMIGVAATIMLFFSGRITGISGILSQALFGSKQRIWRVMFLVGLLSAGFICQAFFPQLFTVDIQTSPILLILAGLLVGFGTRLGSGCTSGHGICGLARLSMRSVVATLIFMGMGILTVTIVRHVLLWK